MAERDWLSELFPDLKVLAADQERVASGYAGRYRLTSEESDKLHMFFSPTRVAEGMTEGEVRVLLLLYDLRESDRTNTLDREGVHSDSIIDKIALPPEFFYTEGSMTRERFKDGVWKFLQQVVAHQARGCHVSH
jgi:hypothetical protein